MKRASVLWQFCHILPQLILMPMIIMPTRSINMQSIHAAIQLSEKPLITAQPRFSCRLLVLSVCLLLLFFSDALHAQQLSTNSQIKHVHLHDNSGNKINIGQLIIHDDGQFVFARRDEAFTDHFLSMKEMKCIEGPELWCHISYPYPLNRDYNSTKAWLSHELLFMYKKPSQFGAKLWQGVYYKFVQDGGQLVGHAYGVDLNELASAPEQTHRPFYDESEMELHNAQERWLPKLTID